MNFVKRVAIALMANLVVLNLIHIGVAVNHGESMYWAPMNIVLMFSAAWLIAQYAIPSQKQFRRDIERCEREAEELKSWTS